MQRSGSPHSTFGFGQQTARRFGNAPLPKGYKTFDTAYEFEFLCMAYGRIPPISIYQLCCHRCGGGIADSWKGKEKMAGWNIKIRFSA
jgi:hypothetical protein